MAIDVYDLLYGKRTGLNTAKILDADEIKVVYRHRKQPSETSSFGSLLTGTRASHFALISESGLNSLVMRSDRSEARPLQNWVTREVLPSIRKTGSYSVSQEGTQSPVSCDIRVL